jgi:hypothetical protein
MSLMLPQTSRQIIESEAEKNVAYCEKFLFHDKMFHLTVALYSPYICHVKRYGISVNQQFIDLSLDLSWA